MQRKVKNEKQWQTLIIVEMPEVGCFNYDADIDCCADKTDSAFANPAESSSSDGEVVFSNVSYNPTSGATYYFKESKAPNGYQLISGTFRVDIDTDGKCSISYKADDDDEYKSLTDSSITNIKQPELPLAGGSGTTMFYVLGAIAVLGAAAAFVLYRKRSLVIGFAKQILRFR